MKQYIDVTNQVSGRVVRVPASQCWRDYIDTVHQFDDLSLYDQTKVIADTIIESPGYWKDWFHQHIAGDWPYIRTIGKTLKKPSRKRVRQLVSNMEFHG